VPAQVERDDAVLQAELLHLVNPLQGLPAETVQENEGALGAVGRNIQRRQAHQRIGGNAYLVTVEVEVYVHCWIV